MTVYACTLVQTEAGGPCVQNPCAIQVPSQDVLPSEFFSQKSKKLKAIPLWSGHIVNKEKLF